MRIWSIHPKYLDKKGLVALWREGLLAKAVLEGKTKGYKNHPQLERFKKSKDPVPLINVYLCFVLKEALKRGCNFDKSKMCESFTKEKIPVKKGQLSYEFEHLKKKLKSRSPKKARELEKVEKIRTHPVFYSTKGNVEPWERL
jgi:hypothetical protein